MCIIAYSKKGHKFIQDSTIKTMFRRNPDGAGYMVKMQNGRIEWSKGYMDVDSYIKAIRELPDDREIALHMRIATDGGIVPANTHPFVVSSNMNDLRQLDGVGDIVLMHNGIINYCKPGGGLKANCSDTMIFASKVLYPLRDKLGNEHIQKTLERAIDNSRLCIFRKNKPTILLGWWRTDFNGVKYSNGSYIEDVKLDLHCNDKMAKHLEESVCAYAYLYNGIPVDESGFELDEYGFEEFDLDD